MDDTAFHYSRALRIIMVLAIVVPLLGIGLLLWYFTSVDVPEPTPQSEGGALVATAPADTHSFDATLTLPDNDSIEDL